MAVNYAAFLQPQQNQVSDGLNNAAAAAMQIQANQAAQAQQARAAEFQQAFGAAYQSGDNKALTSLIGQYPEQFEQIKQAAGFRDEQTNNALGSLGIQISTLAGTDPQAAAQMIAQNADLLRSKGAGYEPENLMKLLAEDPQGLAKRADTFSLLALGPDKYYAVTDQRNKNALTSRGQDVTMRGQDITVRGQDIQRSEGAANRGNAMQVAQIKANATLADAAAKLQAGQTLDVKDVRQINSDLTGFTKEHAGMYSAAKDLETLADRNTPASQLAAIFKYMKALDPTSVVREGEQVMVQRTDGIFGTMGNLVSGLQNGQRLNPEQMQDLVMTAKELANSQGVSVNATVDQYLGSYGEVIPPAQRNLLESRKAKMFDLPKKPPVAGEGGGNAAPTVTTQAAYDALPSGAVYMEDGVQYRKP